MNIWEFINSFLYGFITGASVWFVFRSATEGHPSYSTAWHVGILMGVTAFLVLILAVLPPHLGYQP